MLGVVNKLLKTKSLLTSPSNVLPYSLKWTFPPIIWIFTDVEGDGIESRLSILKSFLLYWHHCEKLLSNSVDTVKNLVALGRSSFFPLLSKHKRAIIQNWNMGLWLKNGINIVFCCYNFLDLQWKKLFQNESLVFFWFLRVDTVCWGKIKHIRGQWPRIFEIFEALFSLLRELGKQ